MNSGWKYLFSFLLLVGTIVWLAVIVFPDKHLHLVACDVGQGDAILVTYGQAQILIDGGPDNRVLDCLASYLPFWDREIEMVVLTHPQADHFTGLIEVFRRYRVNNFLTTRLDSSSQGYEVLKKTVGGSGAKVINPTTGMVIRLSLLYLEIVHPSKEFLKIKSSVNLNNYSIVLNLRLKEFDALLAGDIGPEVVEDVLATKRIRDVEYIKIPHHGSKNGLTKELVDLSRPEVAVISVGKNNRYGHPHKETLKLLKTRDIKIFRTDDGGSIEIISDGKKFWFNEEIDSR